MEAALPLEILLAASMATVMLYSIHLIKSGKGTVFPIYIAGMMFFMNLLGYSIVTGLYVLPLAISSAAFMSFGLVPVMLRLDIPGNRGIEIFTVFMISGEIAMGAFFVSLINGHPAGLEQSIENPWFAYVMITEMAFSALYTVREAGKRYFTASRTYLFSMLLVMAFMPITFPRIQWYVNLSIWESAVVMIISTVIVYETLYRQRLRKTQDTTISLEIMAVYFLMMMGEFVYLIFKEFWVFDFAVIAAMFWFLFISLENRQSKNDVNYTKNGKWTFTFLMLTFMMEWFMGAVLSISAGYFGSGLSGFEGSLSLPWQTGAAYAGFVNAFNVVISVTASPWFLIMMGTEMGMLAFSKLISSRNRENKVRIALMIGAFFIYSIYIPSFSPLLSNAKFIPYMWTMGLGSLGATTSAVLLTGIVGTYVVSGILSILFGSRQLCSVTCTAPLMYQGTFYDSLKKFNRTSTLGKKTLTSRIKPWFTATVLGTSMFVVASAVISYMNSDGLISFSIFGRDLSSLIYMTWFDLLWYVVFVSIPFMGTYGCVNQGWCYWGTFNQAVSYLGFFRLKVRDPLTCVNCKTVDCAFACPVGLTDMRAGFIEKGQFKAFKCVGVGDCVEACPYDNIYMHDVRHAIKDHFAGRTRRE